MKAFVGNAWRDGFLDYHCPADHYRITVQAVLNLESLNKLYVQPARNWRLVMNYVRAIGVKEVSRKILSRSRESFRNEKCVSIGIGQVAKSASGGSYADGDRVLFLATCHPPCVERLALPESLLARADELKIPLLQDPASDKILHLPVSDQEQESNQWWDAITGWTGDSGSPLPNNMSDIFNSALANIENADWSVAQILDIQKSEAQSETDPGPDDSRKSAVLFGYGQYAKTICFPKIQNGLNIKKIHEIDPMQLPVNRTKHANGWSTRGVVNEEDDYDVFVIAGYHHTHTDMAVKGLKKGAAVIIEKPVAVNRQQLDQLTTTLEETGGSLFSCFQKRYWIYNEWAREDLQLESDTPVNYNCIIFEIMLPEGHWYCWPNSGSRIISNGCHWLDHFLFMNKYAGLKSFDVHGARNGTINCSVELENEASMTMVLHDQGSPRIGVQEHVEMHIGGRSAKITQDAYYSESQDQILRKSKVHKFDNFDRMYSSIISRIENGEPGDSIRSLKVSTGLVLGLEAAYQQLSK